MAFSHTSGSQADDASLLARIAMQDEEALVALHRRYVNLAYSMALRVLTDPLSAEEVTQDVFLTIWQHADRYNIQRGSVPTWLLTITQRRAIDRLRHRDARPPGAQAESVDDDLVAPLRPEHDMDLQQALEQLPEEQRLCLDMIYFHGYSQQEVAERLTLPLGTVKGRVRLALQKLRRSLHGLG